MLQFRILLVPVLALIFLAGEVHAQTAYSWANAANGDWNVGSNWNPMAIPGASDSAFINAIGSNYTVALSDTQFINNLTINSANATISQLGTLNLGGTLTLSSGDYQVNGRINGGQIVSSGGTRLSPVGFPILNNVTLGNTANPDVLALEGTGNRVLTFYGLTDFQADFVPTLGLGVQIQFGTSRVLNTSYNLNGGLLTAVPEAFGVPSTITLKTGNVITASGHNNYVRGVGGNWRIDGTVKTNDSGSTTLFINSGSSNSINIGATGSVIAGSSTGNANITISISGGNSLNVDGTIRANSGGAIIIDGFTTYLNTFSSSSQVIADGGTVLIDRSYSNFYGTMRASSGGTITIKGYTGIAPNTFNSSSQFIADGGTINIDQTNTNIYGTLTMMNGGTISLASGTTNITNNGVINVSTPTGSPPSKMEVGNTPESTIQNPGTIFISPGSIVVVGSLANPGTVTGNGIVINNGTLDANLSISGSGTLGGSGTISGSVVIDPFAILIPGMSPGKMTIKNGLTLGGEYGWELGANTEMGPGINFDQIVVTAGNVVINSTASLNLILPTGGTTDPFWASNHSWEIIANSGTGTTSAYFDVSQIIGGLQSNGAFSTSLVDNDLFLNWTFTAVPETSTWAMIAFTGLSAGWAYRRRQSMLLKQLEASVYE